MSSPFGSLVFVIFLFLIPSGASGAIDRPLQWRVLEPDGVLKESDLLTPLGSLWKVFIFAYLVEESRPENPYQCSGRDPDEIFCCKPGSSIDRDGALAQSCGPYFESARLRVDSGQWKKFWSTKIPQAPQWLLNLNALKPEIRVSVEQLLRLLQAVRSSFSHFSKIEAALVGTVTRGTATEALSRWGSTLRVKTYTWRDEETMGFTGGFAGWLPDGCAIWVGRSGRGREAFEADLKPIVDQHMQKQDRGCVQVHYFDRYPIESVWPDSSPLTGPTLIRFKKGNVFRFTGDGSLVLHRSSETGKPKISARLSQNEYVARVIQREVQTQPLAAARAFAIAIRSYLYQNSQEINGCRTISDSSRFQRVSPEKASPQALAIARWSEGLLLDQVAGIQYHTSDFGGNKMSWIQAKQLAQVGYSMAEILKAAYPKGVISFGESVRSRACEPNRSAREWIEMQSRHWRFLEIPGFELPNHLETCAARGIFAGSGRRVFSDLERQAIYVPEVRSREDEISVLHEYLHIGFRNHPRGRNEEFIERLAQKVVEGE